MLIERSNIEAYIPNRAPFIMIDSLQSATADCFISEFTIREDNIFLEGTILREFALIENIAQTAAAGLSYTLAGTENPLKDGVMGSLSKLELFNLPHIGDCLHTEVNLLYRYEQIFLLKGRVFLNQQLLLTCEMKVCAI